MEEGERGMERKITWSISSRTYRQRLINREYEGPLRYNAARVITIAWRRVKIYQKK